MKCLYDICDYFIVIYIIMTYTYANETYYLSLVKNAYFKQYKEYQTYTNVYICTRREA